MGSSESIHNDTNEKVKVWWELVTSAPPWGGTADQILKPGDTTCKKGLTPSLLHKICVNDLTQVICSSWWSPPSLGEHVTYQVSDLVHSQYQLQSSTRHRAPTTVRTIRIPVPVPVPVPVPIPVPVPAPSPALHEPLKKPPHTIHQPPVGLCDSIECMTFWTLIFLAFAFVMLKKLCIPKSERNKELENEKPNQEKEPVTGYGLCSSALEGLDLSKKDRQKITLIDKEVAQTIGNLKDLRKEITVLKAENLKMHEFIVQQQSVSKSPKGAISSVTNKKGPFRSQTLQ